MTSQNKSVGFIIALVGGGVALLAFFALPFVAYGPVSATAVQLTGYTGGQVIWVLAVFAVAILVIAALPLQSSVQLGAKKVAAGILMGMTAVILLQVIIAFFILSGQSSFSGVSAASVLSIGFWVYLLALVAVLIGGIIEAGRSALPIQVMQAPPAAWQSSAQSLQSPVLPTPGSPQYPPTEQYRQSWSPTSPSYPPPYQQHQQPSQYPPAQQSPGSPQWPPTERAPQWPPSQPNQ